jgi:hypothetical protein
MLTKETSIDRIEVLETGHIQVRRATRVIEDGVELSNTYHRWVLSPGDNLEGQDDKVRAVARAVWTNRTKGEVNG